MARNILLAWTNPASVADVDTIEIYRATGDYTDISTTDDAAFRAAAGNPIASETVGQASAVQQYTDPAVTTGNYTYGAFAKNAGGFGPGDRIDSVIAVP